MPLLWNHAVRSSYYLASDPKLRESATVPFWENLLNKEIYSTEQDITVNSQQPLDETTKAVDIVGHYYNKENKPFIFLLLECKRRNKKGQSVADMEGQLYSYTQFFFEPDGLANGRREVYGAVAYGTRIRAWQFRLEGRYVTSHRMWGDNDLPADEASYRDPGVPEDAAEIESFFQLAKDSIAPRKITLPIPSPAVPFREVASAQRGPSRPYTYSMTRQRPIEALTIRSDPDSDTSDKVEAEEHHPLVPENSSQVQVKIETAQPDDLLHFDHNNRHYVTKSSAWEERTVKAEDGKVYDCFLCDGNNSGNYFWTYSLSNLEQLKMEGKGKGKESSSAAAPYTSGSVPIQTCVVHAGRDTIEVLVPGGKKKLLRDAFQWDNELRVFVYKGKSGQEYRLESLDVPPKK